MRRESHIECIYGLVTACEWDLHGKPIKVKISTDREEDYYVVENDLGKQLLDYLKSWVEVKGKVLPFDVMKVIDVEEISKQKTGGLQ